MVKAMEEYLQRIIADMLIVLHFVHAILQVRAAETLCISLWRRIWHRYL